MNRQSAVERIDGLDPSTVLDLLPDAHVVLSPTLDVAYANTAAETMMRRDRADVIGCSMAEFVHPDDLEAAAASIARVQGGTINRDPVTIRLLLGGGGAVPVRAFTGLEDPRLEGHLVVRLEAEAATHDAELESQRVGRLNLLGEVAQSCLNSPVGALPMVLATMLERTAGHCEAALIEVHQLDHDLHTEVAMSWPDRATRAMDYQGSTLLSSGFRLLRISDAVPLGVTFLADRGIAMSLEVFIDGVAGAAPGVLLVGWRNEANWTPSDFDVFAVLADLLVGLVGRASREGELHHRASHDRLTGLPNRFEFEHRAVAHFARLGSGLVNGLAVLFCDLNDFKIVNDHHGHHVGDQVLSTVADRLRDVVRDGDTVGRFGGDEFVILCEVGGLDEALEIADRASGVIREPISVGDVVLSVGAGVGVTYTDSVQPLDELVKQADERMYQAKRLG